MEWVATEDSRLDTFLSTQADWSRSRVQQWIKDGLVLVNEEEITKPAYAIVEGDIVELVRVPEEEHKESSIDSMDLKIEVLYEDEACMVICKPAGYAVHPGTGMAEDEKTILHGIAHLFAERSLPFSPDAVLVHRLDKETTGCLLIAKNPEAHTVLQKQFEDRTVDKSYLAIVAGVPNPPSAVVDAPIGRNLTHRTKMSVLQTFVSREAKTTYRTLDATDTCALLECDLHTGRTHQIRVHLRSIGHPILGDSTYETSSSKHLSEKLKIEGLCLHAAHLVFTSPDTKEKVDVRCDPPKEFIVSLVNCDLLLP